jgi:hypothetical protein
MTHLPASYQKGRAVQRGGTFEIATIGERSVATIRGHVALAKRCRDWGFRSNHPGESY